jgi:hypothetical protein
VLGGLVNDHSEHTLGGQPVAASGAAAAVVWRGIVTPSGNRLAFHDELPPGRDGSSPPTASDLVLGTGTGNLALAIDQTAGTVTLRCDPAPPGSRASAGTLTIECGALGVLNIKAGAGGSVNVDGGARVSVTAKAGVSIESDGPVELKGNPIKLN